MLKAQEKWLKLALPRSTRDKRARPMLSAPWYEGSDVMATDGHRIHAVHNEPASMPGRWFGTPEDHAGNFPVEGCREYLEKTSFQLPIELIIDAEKLATFDRLAESFRDYVDVRARLSVKAGIVAVSLSIERAYCEIAARIEIGTVKDQGVEFQMPDSYALNPAFLCDALGDTGRVELSQSTDGIVSRFRHALGTAIVMAMKAK